MIISIATMALPKGASARDGIYLGAIKKNQGEICQRPTHSILATLSPGS
ncbi:hypothetical protein [Bradyrhizobium sp. JR3.5]